MALIDYTTPDEIRAVLGVSVTELPDTTLALTQYSTLLTLALEDVAVDLPAAYATISALAPVSRTAPQQRLYDLCRLFASYALAKSLLTSLPMFSVASLTDGKAEFVRAKDIYAETKDGVLGMFNTIQQKLSAVYTVVYGGVAQTTIITPLAVLSTLGTDPVTTTAV